MRRTSRADLLDLPPTNAISRGSEEITRRLLETAVKVFGERGFESAKVADIARRCELTTGAIYARWTNKAELFLTTVEYVRSRDALFAVRYIHSSPQEQFTALGAALLLLPDADGPRDLMLEAFVIARRDRTFSEDVARILQQEANALSELVDGGKGSGLIKQSLSTDAIVLFCQALEIGTYLAVNVDDEHRRTPSVDEWKTFVTCFLESLAPDQPSESPNAN